MTRRTVVLGTLGCAAALGAAAAPSWVTARAWTPLAEQAVAVTGLDASPAVGAAALLLLSAGLALALAGPRAARVVAVVVAGSGVLAAVATVGVLREPVAPARGAALAEMGVARVEQAASTLAPWLALVVAVGAVVVAALAFRAAGSWTSGERTRHRRAPARAGDAAAGAGVDDVAAWDSLTRGEDPT